MEKLDWRGIKEGMLEFLKTEVSKRGFSRVVFGLSGGLDSAVVAFLCREAFGDNALAVLMPSHRSLVQNFNDAQMLVELLKLKFNLISLKKYEDIFDGYEGMNKERYGNFCARTRMMLLYDLAYKERALVVGTSNKSERLLGYGTIYGDLACAINPIGDIFKTELYEFARYLGIPEKIIVKKPSADLYEGQSDELELGYPYEEIDILLKEISEKDLDFCNFELISDKIKEKYPEDFLKNILERVYRNHFKLQLPEIFKL